MYFDPLGKPKDAKRTDFKPEMSTSALRVAPLKDVTNSATDINWQVKPPPDSEEIPGAKTFELLVSEQNGEANGEPTIIRLTRLLTKKNKSVQKSGRKRARRNGCLGPTPKYAYCYAQIQFHIESTLRYEAHLGQVPVLLALSNGEL